MGLADSVRFTLLDEQIDKASELFGFDKFTLKRLNDQRLLNVEYIRNVLIKADYERLTSGLHWMEHQDKEYRFPEVMMALQRKYKVSPKVLSHILKGKNEAILFCSVCGVRISKIVHKRTGGLCPNCFADTLEI